MCLAQGHKTAVRLEPATPQSRVNQSTSEPSCFSYQILLSDVGSERTFPVWTETFLAQG